MKKANSTCGRRNKVSVSKVAEKYQAAIAKVQDSMFDAKTERDINYYVYMLINPNDKKPFYVGKGRGNRVFQHIICALTDLDVTSDKYDVIRDIVNGGGMVEHIIVCHGIAHESEAFSVEMAIIDTLNYCGYDLTNEVSGHHSATKGIMTADEIKRQYNAPKLDHIDDDCIIININDQYVRNLQPQQIYQATKEIWRIDKNKLNKIKYVLSEYRGLIVEVFKVCGWYPKERGYNPTSKKAGQKYTAYGFNGEVADDAIRNKYINKTLAHNKAQGQSNPILYSETYNKKCNTNVRPTTKQ